MSEEYTAVDYLHDLATHFSYPDGWHWTRDSDIKRIEYNTVRRADKLSYRIKFTLHGLFSKRSRDFDKQFRLNGRKHSLKHWAISQWATIVVRLPKEKNLPDGRIVENHTIAFWEEDGEYICMMQPSVGKLLAEFLKEDPDHLWAKKLIDELEKTRSEFWKDVSEGKN